MNCLIIGYGSIGARHKSLLNQMGHRVYVVSKRNFQDEFYFKSVEEAFSRQQFEYVIVTNKTSDHFNTFGNLIERNYKGLLLIEKPLFDRMNI